MHEDGNPSAISSQVSVYQNKSILTDRYQKLWHEVDTLVAMVYIVSGYPTGEAASGTAH